MKTLILIFLIFISCSAEPSSVITYTKDPIIIKKKSSKSIEEQILHVKFISRLLGPSEELKIFNSEEITVLVFPEEKVIQITNNRNNKCLSRWSLSKRIK